MPGRRDRASSGPVELRPIDRCDRTPGSSMAPSDRRTTGRCREVRIERETEQPAFVVVGRERHDARRQSRNGLGRTVSPSRIRILPACSRMNDRPGTVGEATSPTGASRPCQRLEVDRDGVDRRRREGLSRRGSPIAKARPTPTGSRAVRFGASRQERRRRGPGCRTGPLEPQAAKQERPKSRQMADARVDGGGARFIGRLCPVNHRTGIRPPDGGSVGWQVRAVEVLGQGGRRPASRQVGPREPLRTRCILAVPWPPPVAPTRSPASARTSSSARGTAGPARSAASSDGSARRPGRRRGAGRQPEEALDQAAVEALGPRPRDPDDGSHDARGEGHPGQGPGAVRQGASIRSRATRRSRRSRRSASTRR